MQRGMRWVTAAMIVAMGVSVARAETAKLELKRYSDQGRRSGEDLPFRIVRSQHFYAALGDKRRMAPNVSEEADFKRLVQKEPEKYHAKHPIRRTAKLGGRLYAFVLDWKAPDSKQYDRLYFDRNRNGDLTDDPPLDVQSTRQGYGPVEFPRVDLTLDAEGAKYDYSFRMQTYSYTSRDMNYTTISLSAAAHREGQITINGKTRPVAIVDFNSDGRFDSEMVVRAYPGDVDGRIYPEQGDVLVVDPRTRDRFAYDITQSKNKRFLAKVMEFDGQWYDVKVSPAGDTLTVTPSSVPLGKVTVPYDQCHAVLYGKPGTISIIASKDSPALMPEGEWRLLAYTIRSSAQGPAASPSKPDANAAKDPKPVSLLTALAKACGLWSDDDSTSEEDIDSAVSAAGGKGGAVLKVSKGEAASLPFGPPYKPIVKVGYPRDKERVSLGLSLVGSGGEVCTNMEVHGGRPERPELTIRTPTGERVETGRFEYG